VSQDPIRRRAQQWAADTDAPPKGAVKVRLRREARAEGKRIERAAYIRSLLDSAPEGRAMPPCEGEEEPAVAPRPG
jgi:hypothetical protein